MASNYFCKNCMDYFKAFVKDLLTSLARNPIPRADISEQDVTILVPCALKCLDLKAWDYDRLCAALDDPTVESCIHQCSNLEDEQYPPQILINLCQLDLNQDEDENDLHRRDLITPPTDTPTGKEPPHTRAPPKITSNNAPTHKTLTLTELTDVPDTRSTASAPTTIKMSLVTTFTTSASPSSPSTSTDSSPSPTAAAPEGTPISENSNSLTPGAKAGIAIGTILICIVLYLALRCCFKHGGKFSHRKHGAENANANEDENKPWLSTNMPSVPEKHGSPVNEIDSRVTVHPPGPVHDGVFELGGEPVVAERSGVLEAPKFLVTGAEESKDKGKAVVNGKEGGGDSS